MRKKVAGIDPSMRGKDSEPSWGPGKSRSSESAGGALVAIQPPRGGAAEVSHGMQGAGWNQHFLARCRSYDPPGDVEFYLSLQHHDHFIDGVPIIVPDPAGGSLHTSQLNPLDCQFERTAVMSTDSVMH
jgi:hypothetical protein